MKVELWIFDEIVHLLHRFLFHLNATHFLLQFDSYPFSQLDGKSTRGGQRGYHEMRAKAVSFIFLKIQKLGQ